MKTILFPTDFSHNANDALKYAIEIAKNFQAEIILFNSYPIPVYIADMPIDMEINQAIKTEAEKKLQDIADEILLTHTGLKISCASNWGFASDEIVTAASDLCADLIIMGTKGASGLKKLFIGSNTASVISKAHCPVLAIPDGIKFKPIKNIAFATDCMDEEFKAIDYIDEWIVKFKSTLTLIHIEDGILNHNFENAVVMRFKEKTEELYQIKNVEYDTIDSPDFVKGINDILIDGNFDLLTMSHHSRNFIEQVINPSHATKLAYQLVTPLLMIPINKKITTD